MTTKLSFFFVFGGDLSSWSNRLSYTAFLILTNSRIMWADTQATAVTEYIHCGKIHMSLVGVVVLLENWEGSPDRIWKQAVAASLRQALHVKHMVWKRCYVQR